MNDEGFMDKNFGIGFFAFDRLFGTLTRDFSGFNRKGYAAAQGEDCRSCMTTMDQLFEQKENAL